ncbi:PhoX family phosphatase [Nocardioides sp. ChNu-153]|uniref:PhoX family protein n=1 Tax=unclassified Nocardioides TaxID=2615069 RepID=UPI0024067BCE|nr:MULTISPECIES: PhoX family phosphatase [unclassified Nocardioides]MDF9714687.1 PhoX family phosphatase [Nocardioides sp. ChNu-99]MDN7119780.1 PhoX family phosphatase [Nocardioides sp. ChNu-153]
MTQHLSEPASAPACCDGAADAGSTAASPTAPAGRRTLPLWRRQGGPHGSRSWATCFYRCGNACDKPVPNTTDNEHVQDVITKAIKRRTLLGGAAVGAGAVVLGTAGAAAAADNRWNAGGSTAGAVRGKMVSNDAFAVVPPNKKDALTVPRGYAAVVVAAWGDPVAPGAPRFDVYKQTAEAAAQQFGYNNDYVGVLNITQTKALLVANHEYTNEELMFPPGVYTDEEQRRIAIASHGMSVMAIERRSTSHGNWAPSADRSPYNKRITGETPFAVTGPVAGHERLRTTDDPEGMTILGTLNNCAGGTTPWGTVLSGEENFNQYFGTTGQIPADRATAFARYGISAEGSRGWHLTWDRFDLAKEPNEPNRFGWIVEVDPLWPDAAPVKHTMLGRFKHEGANVYVERNGRVVVYMGDDERGDYLYKFVSAERYDPATTNAARAKNKSLLTKGTLFVARLTGDGTEDGQWDGTGEWIPLASDNRSYVPGWSVADVLIDTRLAADTVSPTKMDRPEDVEPNLVNGRVYVALTNNSNRGTRFPTDEANPVGTSMVRPSLGAPLQPASGNRNGYVLEMEATGSHTGGAFTWRLLLVCGDPEAPETYFAGYPKSRVSPISCPDNVAFDSAGNLWVSTDGNALGSNDGIFRVFVDGPYRGATQQFLTTPLGAEACGPLITHGDRCVWVAVQHPGEGGTFAEPAGLWPHTNRYPRPAVVVTWKV